MPRLRRFVPAPALLLAVLASAGASGAAPVEERAERARIHAERTQAEAIYRDKIKECATRFIVTSCVDAARTERHETLTRLDERQRVLDEARRKQRAEERLREIEDKLSGEEARRREEAARSRSASAPEDAAAARPPAAASAAAPRAPRASLSESQRAEQEAKARRAYDLKQLQAEAHRVDVERRNQERGRKTNPGAPLPTPAASAAVAASVPAVAPAASAASR